MEHKWVVGIDISMAKFDVCIKEKQQTGQLIIKGSSHMENNLHGFDALWHWVLKRTKGETASLSFIMEATGVYYENLAYYLHEKGALVYVVLPNKAKNYFRSLNIKTKTDKVDAAILAQMGFEHTLKPWKPMSGIYIELRDLTRAILALQADKTAVESRLHAVKHSKNKSATIIRIYEEQLKGLEKSIAQLKQHRISLVTQDRELEEKIKKIATIKGVGIDTAIAVASETNGFLLFTSIRQLISYAGLDVSHNQSGNRQGRSRISKKGNARIRQILFMPAISAVRSNKPIKELHHRIKQKNPQHPIIGVVAGMRKLLLLMYTLWKKNDTFDENHKWKTYGNKETKSSFA